jgi:hypothetical protein
MQPYIGFLWIAEIPYIGFLWIAEITNIANKMTKTHKRWQIP